MTALEGWLALSPEERRRALVLARESRPDPVEGPLRALRDRLSGKPLTSDTLTARAVRYEFDLVGLVEDLLGVPLWRGCNGRAGQHEVAQHLSATRIALRARSLWQAGVFKSSLDLLGWQERMRHMLVALETLDLTWCDPPWEPGQEIRNQVVLRGGHGLGKSVLEAAALLWLGATSSDISGAVYAPDLAKSAETVWRYVDLLLGGSWAGRGFDAALWEEVRAGRTKDGRLRLGDTREIRSKATNTSRGQGSTKVQGAYGQVGIHIFEEARGIGEQDIWDGVRSIVSGREQLWVISENPTQPTSTSSQNIDGPNCRLYTLNCLDHPNVVTGRDVVPGAVTRGWVEAQLRGTSAWAQRIPQHQPELDTFELPWMPGQYWRPLPPWYGRVWGRPPSTSSRDSLVNGALYHQAHERGRDWHVVFAESPAHSAILSLDVARSAEGEGDMGALGRRWRGCVGVVSEIWSVDLAEYEHVVAKELDVLLEGGCRIVEIRVDATGIGAGVADRIKRLPHLARFADATVVLFYFGSPAVEPERYADRITEAYASVDEVLRAYALTSPSAQLEEDLCMRKATWRPARHGSKAMEVLALEPKEIFRRRLGRSPDRGDAIAMVCAPSAARQASGGFEAVGTSRWERMPERRGRR